MKLETLLAIVVPLIVALNGATFVYVLRTEQRLTRIETIIEQRAAGRAPGGQPNPALQETQL